MDNRSQPVLPTESAHRGWAMLGIIAACCTGPMLLIVVLVSVLGFTIGPAAAITLGLVAGGLCVALMAGRHRRQRPTGNGSGAHHQGSTR
jgi:uncharacterized transporter YbjL